MTARALLIAVDTYRDERIVNLTAPRRDINALAGVLRNPAIGGFEVQTLVNPTNTMLHREVEVFFRSAHRDDLLLVHFAGHGFLDDRNRLRLAACDTEEEFLSSTALLTTNIVEIAEQSRSRRMVFIIDCCYSARFFDALSARGDRSVHLQAQFPVQGRGTVVLAASGDLEYAFEDRESSIFTRALVDGLQTGAADIDGDGWISVTDLYAYVLDRLRDRGASQTPRLLGDREGELFIARRGRPAPAMGRVTAPPRAPRPDPPAARRPEPAAVRRPEPSAQPVSRPAEPLAVVVGAGVLLAVVGGVVWLLVWLIGKLHPGGVDIALWIVAAFLGATGILALFRRQLVWGVVLLLVALAVGPGGVNVFS